MLSFIMIASLEDIYYKILNLKDKIQTSNACLSMEVLKSL
jgi:hypothetical protein